MTMTATIVRSPHARYGCLHTPDELFEQLRREGFLLYRENFMWGRTDGFRHADGRCLYVEQGVIRTPEQQYRELMESWHPLRRDERDYQCRCAAAGKLL